MPAVLGRGHPRIGPARLHGGDARVLRAVADANVHPAAAGYDGHGVLPRSGRFGLDRRGFRRTRLCGRDRRVGGRAVSAAVVRAAVARDAVVVQPVLLPSHAATIGDHAGCAGGVALDGVHIGAVYLVNQPCVLHRRTPYGVLRPEENLVAGLRRAELPSLLLVIAAGVSASRARAFQRLTQQLQRRVPAVGGFRMILSICTIAEDAVQAFSAF